MTQQLIRTINKFSRELSYQRNATWNLKLILKLDIWHLTRLYLIHPFYRKDVPNSSGGSREDAGACGHPGGTKEGAACYWSDPRQSWEISVGRWAGYVCGGKKQQKAEANINNTTVSLASHWSDGEVSFRQNHTTCLFKLVCAHSHLFRIGAAEAIISLKQCDILVSLSTAFL